MPGKNNNDENNNDATFPAKLFRLLSKTGMNEMITIGKGCKQHNLVNLIFFKSISASG